MRENYDFSNAIQNPYAKRMQAEYDLSQMKSRKNPYASKLKKSVTIRLLPEKLITTEFQTHKHGLDNKRCHLIQRLPL